MPQPPENLCRLAHFPSHPVECVSPLTSECVSLVCLRMKGVVAVPAELILEQHLAHGRAPRKQEPGGPHRVVGPSPRCVGN